MARRVGQANLSDLHAIELFLYPFLATTHTLVLRSDFEVLRLLDLQHLRQFVGVLPPGACTLLSPLCCLDLRAGRGEMQVWGVGGSSIFLFNRKLDRNYCNQ